MSKAYKCDRCGKFYEGYFIDPEKDYVIGTKLAISKAKFMDLCPICQDSFTAWMKEKARNDFIKLCKEDKE